jgi:hypothetical protein
MPMKPILIRLLGAAAPSTDAGMKVGSANPAAAVRIKRRLEMDFFILS